nr:hypothetical protein 9 [Alphaproteobacteria bacterium]
MTIPADLKAVYAKEQQVWEQIDAAKTPREAHALLRQLEPLTAERKQINARERQRRRRARLKAEAGPKPQRKCLCCGTRFTPKRSDARMCSRKCTERVSWHRKQARAADLEQLKERWKSGSGRGMEAWYPLWFPDLCDLTPEQHQKMVDEYEQLD